MKTCLIIAGEKSGEEHLLSFFPSLQSSLPDYHFYGVAGDEMKQRGVELLHHLNEFSSWGLTEVFHKIPFYYRAMNEIVAEVQKRETKVAILIDFQTFNLKLAQKLHQHGVKILYYVAPQAWAWKEWRVRPLNQSVHTLFTIIPFEKKWFSERGVSCVKSVIHPLYYHYQDELQEEKIKRLTEKRMSFNQKLNSAINNSTPINILLLPGSRNFEVEHLLPTFLETIKELKKACPHLNFKTTLVESSSVRRQFFQHYLDHHLDQRLSDKELVAAMKEADFCLAASGTVTLATALFQLPTLVCYKVSLFTAFFYYNFISYRGPISLANIVHEKAIFPELVQDSVSYYNLKKYLLSWLTDPPQYERMIETLKETKKMLMGEDFSLPQYLTSVIKTSYQENDDSTKIKNWP